MILQYEVRIGLHCILHCVILPWRLQIVTALILTHLRPSNMLFSTSTYLIEPLLKYVHERFV
jgi:hypothetical protein